jgi:hypothetical protein
MIYRQQFNSTRDALRQFVTSQVATLYSNPANLGADGRLTAQALSGLQNSLNGALDAAAIGLSSQASLLPGASTGTLVSDIQNNLLGTQGSSLASRIASQLGSGRFGRSQSALANAINRQINVGFVGDSGQLGRFLNRTPLASLSVDATGQQIPISQFMANQAQQQINNTFGTLANSVGPNAQSALFDSTGAFNSQAVGGFQQQFNNALNTAAFQTGSVLSLFPGFSGQRSQIQSALFDTGVGATGTPNTSFANAMSGVFPGSTSTTPFTADNFNTGFINSFSNAFQNFSTPITSSLGLQPTSGAGGLFQLPSGFFQNGATFPNVLGSQFTSSDFNNGFNNGFATNGSGFFGFGAAPTNFSNDFATGFNNFVTSTNGSLLGPITNANPSGSTGDA